MMSEALGNINSLQEILPTGGWVSRGLRIHSFGRSPRDWEGTHVLALVI